MVEMWSTIPYNASLVDAVEMVVSPRHEKHVKDYLSCSGMTPTVVEENLQRAMDVENEIDPEEDEVITRVTSKLDLLESNAHAIYSTNFFFAGEKKVSPKKS